MLIYTGYFWPSYSSVSCDWVIIDPLSVYSGNKIHVILSYPGQNAGVNIPDKRNDSRIIQIFQKDHKLK